jgi:hypothetical protein
MRNFFPNIHRYIFPLAVSAAVVSLARVDSSLQNKSSIRPIVRSDSAWLRIESVKNCVYDLPHIGKITLKDGAYDQVVIDSLGQSLAHIGLIDLFAFGDLNGDGVQDAVTFMSVNLGGSGIFVWMVILLNDNGSPSHVASYLVGDRVAIDSVKIVGGIVSLHAIIQGPDDPLCCPTLHVSRRLRMEKRELIELRNP